MSRPRIGITRDSDGAPGPTDHHFIHYATSVEKAGGSACPIYYRDDLGSIPSLLREFNGLVFSGGNDLDPALWGEAWEEGTVPVAPSRQRFELALLGQAEAAGLPIFGICLGVQLMNVHRGGSLIQFLPRHQRPNALEHRKLEADLRRHPVRISAGSILAAALGSDELSVNTYHKQAIGRLGQGLRAAAQAPDGVVEAIEDPSRPLFLGVQWHPERLHQEPRHLALFELLVRCARGRGAA
jgi:putative glutamine amidotransferase